MRLRLPFAMRIDVLNAVDFSAVASRPAQTGFFILSA
jgi:hypothetical protein